MILFLKWYRKVADSLTCMDRTDVLITEAGTFCRENRVKLRVVRNRKYVMKLRIRRPRARDSGLYMCFTSVPDVNVTQTVLLTFHGKVHNIFRFHINILSRTKKHVIDLFDVI